MTPAARRPGVDQAAARYAFRTISDPTTRAEVQPLDDGLVAVITLLNDLRATAVEKGLIKGAA